MALLDGNYFEPLNIRSHVSGDKELLAFRLKRPAIVLCNEETGQALASFMWQAHNQYVERPDIQQPREESFAKTALIERARDADGDQIFHGIVDKNRQFCDFLLTNLTGVCGRPTEHAPHLNVALINSGAGAHDQVNYVNVFAPGQTYKVYADMSRGSQKIILDAIVRTESDPVNLRPVQHALSVGKDDAEVASGVKNEAEGIHYALRVLPELGHKRTAELFGKGAKLIWRVQDVVLLFVPTLTTFVPWKRISEQASPSKEFGLVRRESSRSTDDEPSNLASKMRNCMLARGGAPTAESLSGALPCLIEPDHESSSLKSKPEQNLSSSFAEVLSSVPKLSALVPWGKSTTEEASSSKKAALCKRAPRRSCDEESPTSELLSQCAVFARKAAPAAKSTLNDACAIQTSMRLPEMDARRAAPKPPPPVSSFSAMPSRPEPDYEASILNSQAAQMLSGGFAEVIGTASKQTFDLDLSAPVCIIGLSVAVEEQQKVTGSWFLTSADGVEISLHLQCGFNFEQKIEEAYQHWISSNSSVQFRLFRFHDPKGNNWHIVDLSSMTGTQAPAVEVLGRNFIDPQLVVFTELRRVSALQKGDNLALLFANSIRPLDVCIQDAQLASDQYIKKFSI